MSLTNKQVFERLSQLLNIPDLGGEDWDLVLADPARVEEFCDLYENNPLNDAAKFALMELIVASYDRRLGESDAKSEFESRVSKLLRRDFALHRQTIEYWSALKSWNPDRLWSVSPLMREILRERGADA